MRKFKNGEYKTITLCGSSKFKDDFERVAKELTLEGNVVLTLCLFGHIDSPEIMSTDKKILLDDMHKQKILMADEILVINKNGYVGHSTLNEIHFAQSCNIPIKSMEDVKL